jgi:hypothetical protein
LSRRGNRMRNFPQPGAIFGILRRMKRHHCFLRVWLLARAKGL